MGFLDHLLANPQQRQDLMDFVTRYDEGPPEEGYSDQEVFDRYHQVCSSAPGHIYQHAAEQAFARLTPEQRMQFARMLLERAGGRYVEYPELNRPMSDENYQDPRFLAQVATSMHEKQPGLLGQLFGGHGSAGPGAASARGYASRHTQEDELLSNPIAKAVLAGITAITLKRMVGERDRG